MSCRSRCPSPERVVPGDRLVGLHRPGNATHFCHNGRLTATIEDGEFAALFFGIWLSSRTPAPALRAALYGDRH